VDGSESSETFPCFGGSASVLVGGNGPGGSPSVAAALAKRRLLEWHRQFSRFEPDSELSKLNGDPAETVPVSPVMARLIGAILDGARISGGLVDCSLVGELERAGYAEHFGLDRAPPVAAALARGPARAPAGPRAVPLWEIVSLDLRAGTVTRPPGLRFDSGGIAKGLFGDILAGLLEMHPSFAVDCGGDIRFGGAAGLTRSVDVASPFDDSMLHRFELTSGAVATSGIGRRSWIDANGHPAHHLLDAATGRPAFTGVVQVTAIAPSGVEAEILAKTALLRGAAGAAATLRHGGALVHDDGRLEVV